MLLNKSFMNCRIQHKISDEFFCFCFCGKQLEQLPKSVSLAYLHGSYEWWWNDASKINFV